LRELLNISMFQVGGSRWTSNGTGAKEEANRKKHGVDFRTAAKVFLDPFVIEVDDLDATAELRLLLVLSTAECSSSVTR